MINHRMPLEAGTMLTGNIKITKLLSSEGGSSLTYLAERLSENGVPEARIIIKEFYPRESRYALVRDGNKIVRSDADNTVVDEISDKFNKEYNLSLSLYKAGEYNTVFRFDSSDITPMVKKQSDFSGTLAYYLSIATVSGSTLKKIIDDSVDLSLDEALFYTRKILSALNMMHNKNMLHLDIKEDNLFFPDELDDTFCILLDCGSAAELGSITDSDLISCTTRYAAPELRKLQNPPLYASVKWVQEYCSKINKSTDLYSVGVIAFRMIMGKTFDNKKWDRIALTGSPRVKAERIRYSIKERLNKKYPYVYKLLGDIFVKLLYADAITRNTDSHNVDWYTTCDELDKDLTQVLEIIENNGYHPEVLAQQCRDQYKNILLNNNITDEKYFEFNESPFVEKWFAGVSEA